MITNNLRLATVDELSKSADDTADEKLGLEKKTIIVHLSTAVREESEEPKGKGISRAVQELLKRMKELQQLREQQQQLVSAQ